MRQLVVLSDDNRKYTVCNPESFFKHLKKFHTKNGRGDNSIHEENGYYFTVTNDFYDSVVKWLNRS